MSDQQRAGRFFLTDSGCKFELSAAHIASVETLGRKLAGERLAETVRQFVDAGGRRRFDELSEKLRAAYQSAAVEEILAAGHKREANDLTAAAADPAEIMRSQAWQREAEQRLPVQQQRAAALEKLIADERRIVQDELQRKLSAATSELNREYAAKAAELRSEIESDDILGKMQKEAEARFIAFAAFTSDSEMRLALNSVRLPDVGGPRQPVPIQLIGFANPIPCNPASQAIAVGHVPVN